MDRNGKRRKSKSERGGEREKESRRKNYKDHMKQELRERDTLRRRNKLMETEKNSFPS